MISVERKELIVQLHRRGFSNKFIAKHLNHDQKNHSKVDKTME